MSRRMSVDLPEPVEPTRKTNSPRRDREGRVVEADVAAVVALGDAAELDDVAGSRGAGGARGRGSGVGVPCERSPCGRAQVSSRRPSRSLQRSVPTRTSRCKALAARSYRDRMARSPPRRSPTACPSTASRCRARAPSTVLVAFDAGARTERPEENGMAHFLEHLVFKGGEKYDDYRKVNETAERMGGVAQRLHLARPRRLPHHRPRRGGRRGDRPADRLRRAPAASTPTSSTASAASSSRRSPRYKDQPSVGRRAPHRPRRVRRPPARAPRARARGAPAHVHARRDRRLPRAPAGRARAAARSSSATSSTLPADGALAELFGRFPRRSSPTAVRARAAASRPQTLVEERDSNQSHLRMIYRPDDRRRPTAAQRAALTIYSTLLGGSMGSRLFDEIREQRGLCLLRLRRSTTRSPTCRSCSLGAAWSRRKCVEAYTRMREIVAELRDRRARPRRRSSAPAPTPPAAACWPSRTRTRSRATPPARRSSSARTIDPDAAIAALDAVTFDEVAEVARVGRPRGRSPWPASGPHRADEFA